MIYIIQGQEPCFIQDKINEITLKSQGEKTYFDGSDKNFSIDELLEACEGNSLFSQGSLVLVKDPYFFVRKADEKLIAPLMNYVSHPLYDTDLIFYTYEDNFNGKLKTYKDISKNAQVITLNSLDYKNFSTYVRTRINEEKLNMNADCAYYLNTICKRNATLLNQNLQILKLYPGKIDNKVISKLCTASDDNDSFELINAITARDVSKAVSIERRLLSETDSVLSVIGLLANQLRFLYQIAYYQSIGKNRKEIMDLTGVQEYRLSKAIETLQVLKKEEIISLLSKLSDLDLQCKSDSSIPGATRFEMFMLEFLKRG